MSDNRFYVVDGQNVLYRGGGRKFKTEFVYDSLVDEDIKYTAFEDALRAAEKLIGKYNYVEVYSADDDGFGDIYTVSYDGKYEAMRETLCGIGATYEQTAPLFDLNRIYIDTRTVDNKDELMENLGIVNRYSIIAFKPFGRDSYYNSEDYGVIYDSYEEAKNAAIDFAESGEYDEVKIHTLRFMGDRRVIFGISSADDVEECVFRPVVCFRATVNGKRFFKMSSDRYEIEEICRLLDDCARDGSVKDLKVTYRGGVPAWARNLKYWKNPSSKFSVFSKYGKIAYQETEPAYKEEMYAETEDVEEAG